MEVVNKKSAAMTTDDKLTLINLIKKYKNAVENTKTDAASCKEKKEVWDKICAEFNSKTKYKRGVIQLKTTYKNMKRSLRTNIALDKAHLLISGGSNYKRKVAEDDPLLQLLEPNLASLNNTYDSSAEYYEDDIKIENVAIPSTSEIPSTSGILAASENIAECENSIMSETSRDSSPSSSPATPVPMSTTQGPLPSTFKGSRKRRSTKSLRRMHYEYNEANVKKIEAQTEYYLAKKRMCETIAEYYAAKSREESS